MTDAMGVWSGRTGRCPGRIRQIKAVGRAEDVGPDDVPAGQRQRYVEGNTRPTGYQPGSTNRRWWITKRSNG